MDIMTDGPTLVLTGDFDVRSTFAVRNAIYDQLSSHDDVVLDLTGVQSIDLTALKVLAVATRRAAAAGQHLILRGCCPAVRRMVLISGFRRVLDVEDVSESA